jgi:hypothetical protein
MGEGVDSGGEVEKEELIELSGGFPCTSSNVDSLSRS